MAIVKTIRCANGGTVLIDDDCCSGLSAEELERRRLAISRAILEIDRKIQLAGKGDTSSVRPAASHLPLKGKA